MKCHSVCMIVVTKGTRSTVCEWKPYKLQNKRHALKSDLSKVIISNAGAETQEISVKS